MTRRLPNLLAAAILCLAAAPTVGAQEKVSAPFQYEGYTRPEYTSHEIRTAYAPMSDGEELAVDIYLPTDGPERDAFPVILLYTPYQRSSIDPQTGETRDLVTRGVAPFFLQYGYAMAYADMRGTGASTGWLLDFMPRIALDGKELVDWIAAQPWCDGAVGMMGGSYVGWSQTATASHAPEALKCIVPSIIPLEGYTGEVFPGGIYLQGFLKNWSGFMFPLQRNYYTPNGGFRPAKPVTDEDGDGELADEVPLDTDQSGTFLDDGFPPKYADGAERRHIYYHATTAHQRNYNYSTWARTAHFIDSPSPLGYTMYDLGPNAHAKGIMESGVPIYNIGGWFDGFTRGSFELYCTLEGSNPSKLAMPPSYHGFTSGPFWERFGFDKKTVNEWQLVEHLRYFDRYLKGVQNGIDEEPPITIYVMNGEGWRGENEWPLAREQRRVLHLAPGAALTGEPHPEGSDVYHADFTHDSSYGDNRGNRWLGIAGQDPNDLPDRTEKDKQCLVYTSAALPEALEVTGHPIVRFHVSSMADYGDFFVYLEDVDPEGQSILVSEGMLRAGFAPLHDNDEIIASGEQGIEVLPELPWHGFERDQYQERILAGGGAVELVIDFQPTSWVFREGHRIRLAIACADYPTFQLHPKLCPNNEPEDPLNIVPTITLHRGGEYDSELDLPVIP